MKGDAAALVTGKFYPPHAGHLRLLQRALELRDRVVVLVLGSVHDTIRPEDRVNALRQDAAAAGIDADRLTFVVGSDETPYDVADASVWSSHVETFRLYLRAAPAVDLVVAGEPYVEELARRLGVAHERIQRVDGRSSTEIRRDPMGMWEGLGPGTRRMLAVRIVFVGAESTGTTTISRMLADRLRARGGVWDRTAWVPEVGREVMLAKQDDVQRRTGDRPIAVTWSRQDFAMIAAAQRDEEERLAAAGGPVLVCDTDTVATAVWERRYLGSSTEATRFPGRGDVYLLTHHDDVPFVQDGLRDGEDIRAGMTGWFADELIGRGLPWATLTGTIQERVSLAERITDLAVSRRLAFTDPI